VQVQAQMQVQMQQVQVGVDCATLARDSREAGDAAARREAGLVAAALAATQAVNSAAAAKALAELGAELAASEAAAAAARAETAAVRVDLAAQLADLEVAEGALESTLADVAVISAKLGEQEASYEQRLKAMAGAHEAELRARAGMAASDAAAEVQRQQALAAEAAAARERAEASLAALRDEHAALREKHAAVTEEHGEDAEALAAARAELLVQAGKLAVLQADTATTSAADAQVPVFKARKFDPKGPIFKVQAQATALSNLVLTKPESPMFAKRGTASSNTPKATVTSTAELLAKFSSTTAVPHRFHSKPANNNVGTPQKASKPLTLTRPVAPVLHGAKKPEHASSMLSTEQREIAELDKFEQFKARPVNKAVMDSTGDLGVPKVPKRALTKPQDTVTCTYKQVPKVSKVLAGVTNKNKPDAAALSLKTAQL